MAPRCPPGGAAEPRCPGSRAAAPRVTALGDRPRHRTPAPPARTITSGCTPTQASPGATSGRPMTSPRRCSGTSGSRPRASWIGMRWRSISVVSRGFVRCGPGHTNAGPHARARRPLLLPRRARLALPPTLRSPRGAHRAAPSVPGQRDPCRPRRRRRRRRAPARPDLGMPKASTRVITISLAIPISCSPSATAKAMMTTRVISAIVRAWPTALAATALAAGNVVRYEEANRDDLRQPEQDLAAEDHELACEIGQPVEAERVDRLHAGCDHDRGNANTAANPPSATASCRRRPGSATRGARAGH